MGAVIAIVFGVIGLLVGALAAFLYFRGKPSAKDHAAEAEAEAQRILKIGRAHV